MQNAFESPAGIIQQLDRFVMGQQLPKLTLATAVYRHYLGLAHRDRYRSGACPFGKPHVLLIGPTGAGKTYLVQTLARILQAPFCYFSATNLVESGYVGEHVDSLFTTLLDRAGGDLDKAHRGIVFVDEIDKIRRQSGSGRDVSGEGVQTALLPIFDGAPMTVRTRQGSYEFDSSRLMFICAGAFVGLDGIMAARRNKKTRIGFAYPGSAANVDTTLGEAPQSEDLEKFGLIPEFVGRFPSIATLTALTETQLSEILKASEESCLHRQRRLFAAHGIELEIIDDAIDVIARRAAAMKTNARGIDQTLNRVLSGVAARLPDLAAQGVRKILLDARSVDGHSEPIFQKGEIRDLTRPSEADMLRRDAHALITSGVLSRRGTKAARKKKNASRDDRDKAQQRALPF